MSGCCGEKKPESFCDGTDASKKTVLFYACSGGADVAEVADRATREMMFAGEGIMWCVAGLGAGESGLSRMIKLSYEVLGLSSFLTVGEDEVRAWTISAGTLAPKAAGTVHSDIERGFIRAETVAYDDFVECGSMAEARNRGLYRQEGREYVVQDGDIVNFLFSV